MSNDHGVAVSMPGYDVKTAILTDKTKLAYSSQYSNFKIYSILSATLNASAGTPHPSGSQSNPLPYAPPVFWAFISAGNSTGKWLQFQFGTGSWSQDADLNNASCYYDPADNKFHYDVVYTGAGAAAYGIKIVVFTDKFV